jgi:hypothetical protein
MFEDDDDKQVTAVSFVDYTKVLFALWISVIFPAWGVGCADKATLRWAAESRRLRCIPLSTSYHNELLLHP